jgi:hypothetical protein
VFRSRNDYERVIKLLLDALDSLADYADPNEVAAVAPSLDRAGEHARVTWIAEELERADRFTLHVTERPGGWGYPPGGWPDGRPPPGYRAPPASLELRLVDDETW